MTTAKPTKREFQFQIPFCFITRDRCYGNFKSIDGKHNYQCSNCYIAYDKKKEKAK